MQSGDRSTRDPFNNSLGGLDSVSFFLETYEMLGILRRCLSQDTPNDGANRSSAGLLKLEIQAVDMYY